jgi:hypothetical protein
MYEPGDRVPGGKGGRDPSASKPMAVQWGSGKNPVSDTNQAARALRAEEAAEQARLVGMKED